MLKLSVVIRSYNEEAHIGRLLAGILQQTEKSVEIILVDSGSTDATVAIASQFPVKIFKISPSQFSFGRSLNIGCQQAAGEYLVFASAHTYPVFRDWLKSIIEPFSDTDVALVYGRQIGHDSAKYSEQQIFLKWYPEQSDLDQTSYFCNNANVAIRRSLWEAFPYNEELTGLEDIAWAKNIKNKGYKLAYQSEAVIVHVHQENYRQIYNRYRREALALKVISPEESLNAIDCIRYWVGNVYSDLAHAFKEKKLVRELPSIFLFRAAQFYGVYRAHLQKRPLNATVKHHLYYPKLLEMNDKRIKSQTRSEVKYAGDD